MHVVHTEEQLALRAIVRELVSASSPPERVAQIADGTEAYDRELWRRLATELGVTGLLIGEQHGGSAASWREVAAVVGELGRVLACVPYLSSSIAATTVLLAHPDDHDVAPQLLPRLAAGDTIATVALLDGAGEVSEAGSGLRASREGDQWRLRGEARFVPDGAHADVALVTARDEDATLRWFSLDLRAGETDVEAMEVLDATRPMARLQADGAAAALLTGRTDAAAVVDEVVDAVTVGLVCEQAAAAEHLLQLTVAYAKDRVQFGQPIGSFQAIQHRLADLALLVDEATSAMELAVWAASDAPEQLPEAAALAGVVGAEAMRTVATESIQVHGGIGFTWEHVAHRYFRRAHASSVLSGTPAMHRERLLATLGV